MIHNHRRTSLALIAATLYAFCTSAVARDGDAVAIVNGKPVSKSKMVDVLMEGYGLQVMQQLIVLELARQETHRLGLKVRDGDIEHEFNRALQSIAPEISVKGDKLSVEQKQQVLDTLLQQRRISFTEFMLGMERNAHLRKIVERNLRIDEDALREEFARSYGERVQVRHIQVDDIDGLQEALNLLEDGTDFAEVARRISKNPETAAQGGLMEPFSYNDDGLAPVLREAAFALKEGDRSGPIRVGRWWHILKLERRIKPQNTSFEAVRDDVEKKFRDRIVPQRMNELVAELFQKAKIQVLDRELKNKFEELLRRNQLAETAEKLDN